MNRVNLCQHTKLIERNCKTTLVLWLESYIYIYIYIYRERERERMRRCSYSRKQQLNNCSYLSGYIISYNYRE